MLRNDLLLIKSKLLKLLAWLTCIEYFLFAALALFLQVNTVSAFTLDDLIRQALTSYPSVLAKQSTRDAAATDLNAAKLKFLPSPSFNTQRNQVAYDGKSGSNLPSTTASISQPLFLDGGIIAGYNKADARLSAADFSLLETREDISKRIIGAYTDWLKAYLKIQAYEENVKLHERFAGMITRRYEQGVASGSDRDLGISRLMQARADLDTQKSVEETALTSLSELVGEPLKRVDLINNTAKPLKIPARQLGILQAQAQSVTVQRYKYEADAAEQEAKEIRAQALPQVSFQLQRQVGSAVLPGYPSYNMAGFVLNYVPGGGFSSAVAASAAFERARSAMIQVETAKRELTDRLNADYNEYEFSLLRKESLQRSVELSGDISASYDRQYLVGRKSWLDLMNSVREQAQTRVQYADAEGSLLGSSRRLMIYIEGTKPYDSPADPTPAKEVAINKKPKQ